MESSAVSLRGGADEPLQLVETRPQGASIVGVPTESVLWDRYRVTATIQAGPEAATYRAQEIATGQAVAVKVWHEIGLDLESKVEMFRRLAARSDFALWHLPRAFIAVRDVGFDAHGRLVVVTELVEGPSLGELIEAGAGLEAGQALALAMRIGEALTTALDLGFPELRMSPADIIVVDIEDSVKIVGSEDLVLRRFGLTGARTDSLRSDPRYAAPEELAGGPPTTQSAIYRFGLLLRALMPDVTSPLRSLDGVLQALRLEPRRPLAWTLGRLTARMTDPNPAARGTDIVSIVNELWDANCRLTAAEPDAAVAPHRWLLVALSMPLVTVMIWLVMSWSRPDTARVPAEPAPTGDESPSHGSEAFVPAAPSPARPPAAAPVPSVPLATRLRAAPAKGPPSRPMSVPSRPAPSVAPRSSKTVADSTRPPATAGAVRAVPSASTSEMRLVPTNKPSSSENEPDPRAIIDWLFSQGSRANQ